MKPHIVIDARLYGPKHTGIGRYTKNLLLSLKTQPHFSRYRFTLLVYWSLLNDARADLSDDYHYIPTNIPHYSLAEQTKLPSLINSLRPDLIHFTHFNKPLTYTSPSVITIHDLIKHYFRGKNTTTHNQFFYWPKYWAYLITTAVNIRSTNRIIVPSDFWRHKLTSRFHLPPDKVTTIYEAVDPQFISTHKSYISNPKPYLVYTGNLYPHKNVTTLLQALQKLPQIQLKIIGADNSFSYRFKKIVNEMGLKNQVQFLGYISDQRFRQIYSHALALVHPSFMEGFSLTGLEAMALGCPVISSNSSCLPEIYGKSVLYFDPYDPSALTSQIKKLQSSPTLRSKLIHLGYKQVDKYSWDKTAAATLQVYRQILNN